LKRVGKEKDCRRKRKRSVIVDYIGGDVGGEILIFGEIKGKFIDIWLNI